MKRFQNPIAGGESACLRAEGKCEKRTGFRAQEERMASLSACLYSAFRKSQMLSLECHDNYICIHALLQLSNKAFSLYSFIVIKF